MKSARQRILSNRLPTRKTNRNTTLELKNDKNKSNKFKKNNIALELDQLEECIDAQKHTAEGSG